MRSGSPSPGVSPWLRFLRQPGNRRRTSAVLTRHNKQARPRLIGERACGQGGGERLHSSGIVGLPSAKGCGYIACRTGGPTFCRTFSGTSFEDLLPRVPALYSGWPKRTRHVVDRRHVTPVTTPPNPFRLSMLPGRVQRPVLPRRIARFLFEFADEVGGIQIADADDDLFERIVRRF